jgi:hypothetical protein
MLNGLLNLAILSRSVRDVCLTFLGGGLAAWVSLVGFFSVVRTASRFGYCKSIALLVPFFQGCSLLR